MGEDTSLEPWSLEQPWVVSGPSLLGLGSPWTSQTCCVEGLRTPAFQAIFLLLDKCWVCFPSNLGGEAVLSKA